ncbi:MAG: hypothetical protein K2Y14_03995 [Burkholderiales bacterium]|nr:hypothetical protein [Burkholderiales bacterium]
MITKNSWHNQMNKIFLVTSLFAASHDALSLNKEAFINLLDDCTYNYYNDRFQDNSEFKPTAANLKSVRESCSKLIGSKAVQIKNQYSSNPYKPLSYYIGQNFSNIIFIKGCMLKNITTTKDEEIRKLYKKKASDLTTKEKTALKHWNSNNSDACSNEYATNMEDFIKSYYKY